MFLKKVKTTFCPWNFYDIWVANVNISSVVLDAIRKSNPLNHDKWKKVQISMEMLKCYSFRGLPWPTRSLSHNISQHHCIQHLRPYTLFETLSSIWDLFHSTFKTLLVIWHPFRHSIPFWRTFETLFVIWGPFQHLRTFSFSIWDFIRYLRPFSFIIWDLIGYLTPFSAFDTLLADSATHS